MRPGVLTIAISGLFLAALSSSAPGQDVTKKTPPPPAAKFDHDAHAKLTPPVPVAECGRCHGADPKGELGVPGDRGHQPCLAAGCHAEDFMSVGPRTKKESPERYLQAASFCAGCHTLEAGVAPSPFAKIEAKEVYKNNDEPGHHVEMNHLAHVKRTKCRTCHVVDAKSFVLVLNTPGHSECATCHEDNDKLKMSECAGCHQAGSPASYFKPREFQSDVRSCDSPRYQELSKARQKKVPCFAHEREGHRFTDGQALQCNACHFMFESKSYAGHDYKTLRGIKQAPLMDNRADRAHRKCGTSGCHRQQVSERSGSGDCSYCHSSRSVLDSLTGSRRSSPRSSGKRSGSKRQRGSELDGLLEGGSSKPRKKKESLEDLVD